MADILRHLDTSGRFPDRLLGLSAGTVLTIEERSGGILLKPVGSRAGLVRKEGVLVFAGEAEEDLAMAVQRDRDERSRKVAGLG
jgi:hypothetical protein